MELRDIEYFVNVARHGKLHRAAEAMAVSQPALTKAIRRMEKELGAPLFTREPRGVTLTPVGDIFMRHVLRVRVNIEQAKREIADFAGATGGHLNIGVAPAVNDTWLPGVCLSLLEEAPQATLRIFTAMNDMLMPAVHSGDLDLAISGIASHPPADLAQELLGTEDFFPVVGPHHPLHGKKGALTPQQLAKLRWILSPHNLLSRQGLSRAFAAQGLPPPQAVIETNSVSTVLRCVAGSDLAGFVPISVLKMHGKQLRLSALNPRSPLWHRNIGVTYRAHAYIPPLAYRLIKTLRREISKQL